MVCGIASIPALCIPGIGYLTPIAAIVAIVLGFIARGKVKRGEAGGGGMALAGIILGFIYFAVAAVLLIVVVIFGFAMLGFAGQVIEEAEKQRQQQQGAPDTGPGAMLDMMRQSTQVCIVYVKAYLA